MGSELGASVRRLPVGAERLAGGGVHFRLWAPRRLRATLVLEGGPGAPGSAELRAEGNGYFSGLVGTADADTRYRFRLDDDDALLPDPASRFQPRGPHGPSQVVDPAAYGWRVGEWEMRRRAPHVLYELHVGTFTAEGSWSAAAEQLEELAALGITLVEVMPVAEFPGAFGWGYDGVDLFAPSHLYGEPDDFRAFVDRAHEVGVGVILDVVYNHLGPDGDYLPRFSDSYFTDRYRTDWGQPFNYDGPDSKPVRELVLSNAAYWIDEFRLDGLRLDATQNIYDGAEGSSHILAELVRAARNAAGGREIFIVAENEPQDTILVRPPARGGYDIDAMWNDDFHHAAMVALTGRNEAYYSDYLGRASEFVAAAKWGILYQGQRYEWQGRRRGTPALDLPAAAFVSFIQNHDQIANSARGDRADRLTPPGRLRAMTALALLGQATPMLFMGQEFAASAPFLYFADQKAELRESIREGRRDFLQQFPSLASPEVRRALPDPGDPRTFARCKLDFGERARHRPVYELHRDLLRLRRMDPVLGELERRVDGAVLSQDAFVLRFFGRESDDRLLLVNLRAELRFAPAPEPLLAPPRARRWALLWSSEAVEYGGAGVTEPESADGAWRIAAEAAFLLGAEP